MKRTTIAIAFFAAAVTLGTGMAQASTVLDRIKAAGKIELGYREDAQPFSYKDSSGQPAGYTVEVCKALAEDLKAAAGAASAQVEWVPVTVDDRMEAVQQGKIDLLCGASTITMTRRKVVSFSIPIFNSGIGAVIRSDAPVGLRKLLNGETTGPVWRGSPALVLQKKNFAVVGGTTSETWLNGELAKFQITATVNPVKTYDDGIASLLDRSNDVFVGDRPILVQSAGASPSAGDLVVIDRVFAGQPLALALDRNDEDFRLAVDQALSKLYHAPGFRDVYVKWFGQPDQATLDFFRMMALPE